MVKSTEVEYPSGTLIRFCNPEDTGLMLGGRVMSSVPARGDFEGGYLVACHYFVPKEYIETEFKDSTIYPIKPEIARRLEAGHPIQDIALTYNMTVEEVQYLSPQEGVKVNNTDFVDVQEKQFKRCEDILNGKAAEYATDVDRLHNFRVVAALQGISMHQAVVNLMAKHTVSVYDMAQSDKPEPMDLWDEKITDHINYLILLKATLVEEEGERVVAEADSTSAVHNPNL